MAILIDTSVLGRLANRTDPAHTVAANAIAELHRRGDVLCITAQNLIEFHNFATRPVTLNGLGLSFAAAERLAATFEATFSLLVETPDVYLAWRVIAKAIAVVGKQVHDARLVAICHTHGVTHLLTFNISHFTRFVGVGPGIVVVDPATV